MNKDSDKPLQANVTLRSITESGRPCTAVKRPREAMEASTVLRQWLKEMGNRAAALGSEVAKCMGTPGTSLQEEMWDVVLTLRSYVLGVSMPDVYQLPEDIRGGWPTDEGWEAKYSALALKIYYTVIRIVASVPSVLLHCVLTLFSMFPVVGLASRTSPAGEVFFKSIWHGLDVLHNYYPSLLLRLFKTLLEENVIEAFAYTTLPGRRESYRRCTLQFAPPPEVVGFSGDKSSLFKINIVAQTPCEGISTAYSLCAVMNRLLSRNLPLVPTLRQRFNLLRLGCSLLSVELSTSLYTCAVGSGNTTTSTGFQRRGGDEGVLQTSIIHEQAIVFLHVMMTNHFLVMELHAPIIAYTLTHHLYDVSRAPNPKKEINRELDLLRWLVGCNSDERQHLRKPFDKVGFRSNNQCDLGAVVITDEKDTTKAPNKCLERLFLETNFCDDVIATAVCCANCNVDKGYREVTELFVALLQKASTWSKELLHHLEVTIRRNGETLVEAFLCARVFPRELFLADIFSQFSALHPLMGYVPRQSISLLSRKIVDERSRGTDNDACRIVSANASPILSEENVLLREAWKDLMSQPGDVTLDAVLIILRTGVDGEYLSQLALEMLHTLNLGGLDILQLGSPFGLSLLYAEVVRRLSFFDATNASNISKFLREAFTLRADGDKAALWRIIGVIRGLEGHVTHHCQPLAYGSTLPSLGRGINFSQVGVTTVAVQRLLDALEWATSFINEFCKSGYEYSSNGIVTLLSRVLTAAAELFVLSKSTRAMSDDACEVPQLPSVSSPGEKACNMGSTNSGVIELVSDSTSHVDGPSGNVSTPPQKRNAIISCEGAFAGIWFRLQEVLSKLVYVLLTLLPEESTADDPLYDTVAAALCMSNLFFKVPDSLLTQFVISHGLGHKNKNIRCGYAALALRIILEKRPDVDVAKVIFSSISGHRENVKEDPAPSRLLAQLETLHAVFTGEWEVFIGQDMSCDLCSGAASLLSLIAPSQYGQCCGKACRDILDVCRTICESEGNIFAAKAAALDVAHIMMSHFSWSLDYLFWCDVDIIHTAFFRAMCYVQGKSVRDVVLWGIDDILPRCLLADDGKRQLGMIYELVGESLALDAKLPVVLAYIFLCDAESEFAAKLDKLDRTLNFCSRKLNELPKVVNQWFASIIAGLMYIHGGNLVLSRDKSVTSKDNQHQEDVVKSCSLELCSSVTDSDDSLRFKKAVNFALSMGQSAATEDAVRKALRKRLTSSTTDTKQLTSHVFSVLDTVAQSVGIDNGISVEVVPVSIHSSQRWLLGLTSLIQYLGPQATVIAPKLPAILDFCSKRPQLVSSVCVVWQVLLSACTEEYLSEHAPSIVVDLLSMEPLAEVDGESTLASLNESIKTVYDKSKQQPFWELYFKVMGRTSTLIRDLRKDNKTIVRSAKLDAVSEQESAKKNADVIVTGLLSVVQNSSTKCKMVFVRALYQYLLATDIAGRMELTRAAKSSPQLIPTLLNCIFELHGEYVQYVLSCVGMIGAIGYSSIASVSGHEKQLCLEKSFAVSEELNSRRSSSSRKLTLKLPTEVLDWRIFAKELLSVQCPRALANTADPTMHDRAAFAVQELLRVFTDAEREFRCYPTLQSNDTLECEELQRYSWWRDLNEPCRQMIGSYTTTRYSACVRQVIKPHSPIYTPGMEFHKWLNTWFCDLVLRCNGVFGRMMAALRNMAKGEQTLINFLLPHMIIHLINSGDENHLCAVITEIKLLLEAASESVEMENERGLTSLSQGAMTDLITPLETAKALEEHVQQVFNTLEDIERLCVNLLHILRVDAASEYGKIESTRAETVVRAIHRLFSSVPWTLKVRAALGIGSCMRALRFLEGQRYIPKVSEVHQQHISLQRIFAVMNDRDSSRSIHHMVDHGPGYAAFSHENNGEWAQALRACELVLQQTSSSINHQFTALRCMQQLGQLHLMSRYSQALLRNSVSSNVGLSGSSLRQQQELATLQNYANEAAWRLSEWDSVQVRPDLPVSLALPMVALTNLIKKNGTSYDVFSACKAQRQKIVPVLRAACRESYVQVYPHVVFLHALTDIESAAVSFAASIGQPSLELSEYVGCCWSAGQQSARWQHELGLMIEERASLTEATLETQEMLLSLHRSIFRAFQMNDSISRTWIRHVKLLRSEGFFESALSAVQQAALSNEFTSPSYCTISAKLLYEMNMSEQAIKVAEGFASDNKIPREVRAKLRVLVTRWRQDSSYQTPAEIIASYQAAIDMFPLEMAHHHLGMFYETLYRSVKSVLQEAVVDSGRLKNDAAAREEAEALRKYVMAAITHFGSALQLGCKTAAISLPRMLTLWLNCSASVPGATFAAPPTGSATAPALQGINALIERYLLSKETRLSPQLLITALPQLLSRIGHENADVVNIIAKAIVLLMQTFPQQCLWQVLPFAFSRQISRSITVQREILERFVASFPREKKIVDHMNNVFKALIELCNCSPSEICGGDHTQGSLARKAFLHALQKTFFAVKILLPVNANLSPDITKIPSGESVFAGSSTFVEFLPNVTVMSSLQRPKRVSVTSSDGQQVLFLCKSKDEPRKDMRIMELAALMNSLFLADPESRRKRFALRRYAVTALNDDCGIIEWVNNLNAFRNCVDDCYKIDGTGVRISQVKAWKAKVDYRQISKLDLFLKYILPKSPPVFHTWFHHNFHSHQEWYHARTIYTQATALWSMVGHIVGLGDRHGENIMLDVRSGEAVHVDFACMFDKGETLEVAERVRFRLTQNVVDGMGILGVDGPFRACCHGALRCQMKNKTAIMSVVETLLHDPLVEWMREHTKRHRATNPKQLIGRVSRRLDGFLDLYNLNNEKDALALGCEGQVSRLISHCSAIENLSEMYIWWMAWM